MEKVKCKICNNIFSNLHIPYFLPCGHTLCFQCIERIKSECLNEDNESFLSKSKCSYFDKLNIKIFRPEFDIDILLSDDEENVKKKTNLNFSDSSDTIIQNSCQDNKIISEKNLSHNQSFEFFNCSLDNLDNFNSDNILDNKINNNLNEENNEEEEDDNNLDLDNNNENEEKSSSSSDNNDDSEVNDDNFNYILNDNDNIKEEKSFKFKCPFCEIKVKLKNSDIKINNSLLEYNMSFINRNEIKKFFCQKCKKIILNDKEHLEKNHDNFTLELSNKHFKLIKNRFHCYKKEMDNNYCKLIEYLKIFFENSFETNNYENIRNLLFNNIKYYSNYSNIKIQVNEKIQFLNNEIKKKKNIVEKTSFLNSLKTLFSNYLVQNHKLKTVINDLKKEEQYILLLVKKIFENSLINYLSQGYFYSILNKTFYHQKKYIIIKDKFKNKCIYDTNLKKIFNFQKLNELTSKTFISDRNGEYIYCFGEEKKISSHFKRLNIFTNEIEHLPNITLPLIEFDTILHKNYIYLIGGKFLKNEYSKLCFKYDIQFQRWDDFPELNEQLISKKMAILNDDKLIVFNNGGKNLDYSAEYITINHEKNFYWEKCYISEYNNFLNNFNLIPYNEFIIFLIDVSENIGYIINLHKSNVISTFKINKKIYMNKYFSSKLSKKVYKKNLLNIYQNIYWKQLINIPLTLSKSKYNND